MGATLKYGENTTWAVPCLDTLEGAVIRFDENNPYYRLMEKLSVCIAQNAPDNYFYGITDLHPSLDTLCALRGAENLMIDMADQPDNRYSESHYR